MLEILHNACCLNSSLSHLQRGTMADDIFILIGEEYSRVSSLKFDICLVIHMTV